jgi:hypothetical protein
VQRLVLDTLKAGEAAAVEERIDLLCARSGALTAVGRFADSHAALVEALAIVPEGSHVLRAKLWRVRAAVESLLGRHEQAGTRLAGALDGLPDQGSPEAIALMTELAVNLVWRARYEEVHQWAERAVTAARRLGEAPLIAAALAACDGDNPVQPTAVTVHRARHSDDASLAGRARIDGEQRLQTLHPHA